MTITEWGSGGRKYYKIVQEIKSLILQNCLGGRKYYKIVQEIEKVLGSRRGLG